MLEGWGRERRAESKAPFLSSASLIVYFPFSQDADLPDVNSTSVKKINKQRSGSNF